MSGELDDAPRATTLGPVPGWWVALYAFGFLWLVVLFSLDASHFGPGFFPLLISIVLVPLLAVFFLADLFMKIFDAVLGSDASWPRRVWPLAVAASTAATYGAIGVLLWRG